MGPQRAQFETFAWSLARARIGQGLREVYALEPAMPLELLTAVRKLDTAEADRAQADRAQADHPAKGPRWLRRLDAIEGSELFRACSKRVRSLPGMRGGTSAQTRSDE
jgi:hypothetical protein